MATEKEEASHQPILQTIIVKSGGDPRTSRICTSIGVYYVHWQVRYRQWCEAQCNV